MTLRPPAVPPDPPRCWLCGTTAGPMRSDVHCSGRPLCPRCWDLAPRGYNRWVRSASALYVLLSLPRVWHDSGMRCAWLQRAAERHGITAWHDVDRRTTPDPEDPFGWLTLDQVEAAVDELAAREAEFERGRAGAMGAR